MKYKLAFLVAPCILFVSVLFLDWSTELGLLKAINGILMGIFIMLVAMFLTRNTP